MSIIEAINYLEDDDLLEYLEVHRKMKVFSTKIKKAKNKKQKQRKNTQNKKNNNNNNDCNHHNSNNNTNYNNRIPVPDNESPFFGRADEETTEIRAPLYTDGVSRETAHGEFNLIASFFGVAQSKDCVNKWTTLLYALKQGKSTNICLKLIELGGRALVLKKDQTFKQNALHYALNREEGEGIQVEVIMKLIEVGGKDVVSATDFSGSTPLHLISSYAHGRVPIQIIEKMINVGGKSLLFMHNLAGATALHMACAIMSRSTFEIVEVLLKHGGNKLLFAIDANTFTALHIACQQGDISCQVLESLLAIGGKQLALTRTRIGDNALHFAVNMSVSPCAISALIDVGGADLLMLGDLAGRTALHKTYFPFLSHLDDYDEGEEDLPIETRFEDGIFELLIRKGLELQAGGEFSLGGLFSGDENHEINEKVFDLWYDALSVLEDALIGHYGEKLPPILHTLIIHKAYENFIDEGTFWFEGSILSKDSLGRYPIEVAVQCHLSWGGGMASIAYSMATAQERNVIFVACEYGLPWHDIKQVVNKNMGEIVGGRDTMTNLPALLLAASGKKSDLSTLYELTRITIIDIAVFS
jgi:hypothetical protein